MKIRIRRPLLSARTQRWVRWTRRLFFINGNVALGYVVFTLAAARLYQVSAKRSLETQILVEEQHKAIQSEAGVVSEPVVGKQGDELGYLDDAIGRLDIPRLGISVAVLRGTDWQMLRLGAGHIKGTPLPGEAGNSGIAGHRDTFFRELKDVRKNDEIQFQTATGLYHYKVDWMAVVAPDDTSVLAPSTGPVLTLVTCFPFEFLGSAPKRFVVRAHQY
jgi:sortase A